MPNPELSAEHFFGGEEGEETTKEERDATISTIFESVLARIEEIKTETPPSEHIALFSAKMIKTRDRFPQSTTEGELIIVSFFGVGAEIKRQQERAKIQQEIKQATLRKEFQKRSELLDRIGEINIASADWQINAGRMIMMLEGHPQERQILKQFWHEVNSVFSTTLPEKVGDSKRTEGKNKTSALRIGILSPITTVHILRTMGLPVSFPAARQDAVEKIDLWAWREERGRPGRALAVQIKTASSKKPAEIERRAQQTLIRRSESYSALWGITVKPIWLTMLPASNQEIDSLNGKPNQDFIDQQIQGEFGASILKALKIKNK